MAGWLADTIQGALLGAFEPLYPSGVLVRLVETVQPNGDIVSTETQQPIKVQRDAATEAMRQSAGYTDSDVRLIVLEFGGEISTDDEITDGGGVRWKIASATRAADNSHWECRGIAA